MKAAAGGGAHRLAASTQCADLVRAAIPALHHMKHFRGNVVSNFGVTLRVSLKAKPPLAVPQRAALTLPLLA
jgi:hypothetical protein